MHAKESGRGGRLTRRLQLAAGVAAVGLLASGCLLGEDSAGGDAEPGSLAKSADLEGVEITVGSKEFTEQLNLCEITALALESAGADVTRKCGLSGSNTTRTALTSGKIDVYWEYTGTAWISYLKHTKPVAGADAQYDAVAKEDKSKHDIVWLDKAPFNNTYAVATTNENAKKSGVTSLSAYSKLANENVGDAGMCVNGEFSSRDDGLPGVQKHYGFKLPSKSVATLEEGAIYKAIDKQSPCKYGMVTPTDGRIKGLGLTVLKDDKAFFPIYNPAPNVRKPVLDKNPAVAKALNPLAKALDLKTIQELNTKVDIDGEKPKDVAEEWLQKEGFIGK
ncbi:MAG: glycine/betaine ABC transporter substrate-binding protein [Streptosporangiales bacterium]|nr:glycine/betaine ABC transporter substrate-binding protein [Streptosporangiales bacterium]